MDMLIQQIHIETFRTTCKNIRATNVSLYMKIVKFDWKKSKEEIIRTAINFNYSVF